MPYDADREWFTLAITVLPKSPPKQREKPAKVSTAAKTDQVTGGAKSKDEVTTKQDESARQKSPPKEANLEAPSEPLSPKTFYYTFIVFPPGESTIGSVEDEPYRSRQGEYELRHTVNLTRPFALLDREVTFEELIAFSPDYTGYMQQFKAQPSDAGFSVRWYDSVSFCRWLSEQSGLSESDQCYVAPETLDKEQYPRDLNTATNMFPSNWPLELARRGFRLPTESEWEVAARSGSRTAYGFGSELIMIARFGWFAYNSGEHVHTPRELRPTIRGAFDLHGNVNEFTHDFHGAFDGSAVTDSLGAKVSPFRVLRGGGYVDGSPDCRSAFRGTSGPSRRGFSCGFRIALSPSVKSPEAEQKARPLGSGTE